MNAEADASGAPNAPAIDSANNRSAAVLPSVGVEYNSGSMNFDNRSMALNDESTLMILDPTIGRQMDQIFLHDLRHSEEITLTRAGH